VTAHGKKRHTEQKGEQREKNVVENGQITHSQKD
jgi:hypothetical protein